MTAGVGHFYNANSGIWVTLYLGQQLKDFCSLESKTSIVLCAPSTQEGEHRYLNTSAFVIGQVVSVVWKLTLSSAAVNNQSKCMVSGTAGLLVMEIAQFTMLLFLGYHHME